MNLGLTAMLCHNVNRAICQAAGDNSQKHWSEADEWQKQSIDKGIQFRLENPSATPAQQHQSWYDTKVADGWVYGDIKDPIAKTHPCLVPYDELPFHHRVKDCVFAAIVDSMITVPATTPA